MTTGERIGQRSSWGQGGAERRRRGRRWRRSGERDGARGGLLAESHDLSSECGSADLRMCRSGDSSEPGVGGAVGRSRGTEIDRDPQRMSARLQGVAVPTMVLESHQDRTLDLARLASGCLTIYLYPGNAGFPSDWQRSIAADAFLHQVFRDHKKDLEPYRCEVVGVSTQPSWMLFHSRAYSRLDHHLLSDPELKLADALELPNVEVGGRRFYEQQVLIVRGGRIRHIFYPVNTTRCATQVAAWLKLN